MFEHVQIGADRMKAGWMDAKYKVGFLCDKYTDKTTGNKGKRNAVKDPSGIRVTFITTAMCI